MIEIVKGEDSCNGCGERNTKVYEISVFRIYPGSHRVLSGTCVRLCEDCLAELQEAINKEAQR